MDGSCLKFIIILILLNILNAKGNVEGENVCFRHEPYFSSIKVENRVPNEEKYVGLCWNGILPYWCTKSRTTIKEVTEDQRITKRKLVKECCLGYYEFAGSCEPMCPNQCLHGTCIAPNKCACVHGYSGERCEIPGCPLGKYGENCSNECACANSATCDPNDGSCTCTAGYDGRHCENNCQEGKFGQGCLEECRCIKGICDHITGSCTCNPGWTGNLCDETCPEGTHGTSCKHVCTCQNGGHCHSETGECICALGWSGSHCESSCPEYYWGTNCSQVCACENGSKCHHITGECICEPGFTGSQCSNICPDGLYGKDCSMECDCKDGTICNNVYGTCTYPSGQNYIRCPEYTWGDDCKPCNCVNDNSEGCNLQIGTCYCKPGWKHDNCSAPCSNMTFGQNCIGVCTCENQRECSPVNGSCTCPPGYRGRECKDICPTGTFGPNCAEKCELNATCDPITGKNFCTEVGYMGPTCSEECIHGYYGQNCRIKCNCRNGLCHHKTGICCLDDLTGTNCKKPCPKGTFGPNCQRYESCPDNFYGDHCKEICNCMMNFICDTKLGCICRQGEGCDLQTNTGVSINYVAQLFHSFCIIILTLLY